MRKLCYEILNITHLIKDIINIINEYVNDILILNYDIEKQEYFEDEIHYSVTITSKNVFINYEKYNFKYEFLIINYNGSISYGLYEINDFGIRSNTNNRDIYLRKLHAYYTIPQILPFFNEYIRIYYVRKKYIPFKSRFGQFCKKSMKFGIYEKHNLIANVSKISHKKLKNIIVMLKIITPIIFKISDKHF